MRMTPAFSGTRATWIAIAVVVASVVFVFLNFYGEPIVLRLSRAYFSAGEGLVLVVPAAFWLGLTRLPQVSMGRAWAEAIGINVTLSLVIEVIEIVVSSRIYGYNPLIFLTRDLIETSIIALIASVIGQGLAAAFASWSAVRGSVIVGRSGTGALWWAIGGVMAANFVFFALNFWSAYFRMIYLLRIWGMLPVMPVAILIVWYASWSTLRLLRQRAAAPGVPVAPGVPGVWQQR